MVFRCINLIVSYLAPLKKTALVVSWLATAYNEDLISSKSLLTIDDCNSNEPPQNKTNVVSR